MRRMTSTPNQAAYGSDPITDHASQACGSCIERNGASRALDGCCNSEEFAGVDLLVSAQGGIADEVDSIFGAFTNHPMKNQAVVISIKKQSAGTKVLGAHGSKLNPFSVEKGGGHTLPPRLKANRRILGEQRRNQFSVIRGWFAVSHGLNRTLNSLESESKFIKRNILSTDYSDFHKIKNLVNLCNRAGRVDKKYGVNTIGFRR